MSSKDLSDKITEYEPMMFDLCKRVFGYVSDDLMQICRVAVWEGLEQFDSSRGSKLSTFIYHTIRNNLLTKMVKHYTRRRVWERDSLSLDMQLTENEDDRLIDILADPNVRHPVDNISDKEMPEIILEILKIYIRHQSNRPKCKNTGQKLIDYLVLQKSPKYMRKKWGDKYDNVLLRFAVFMRKYISRNEIKLNIEERVRWDKKSREIRFLRGRIGFNRGRKYQRGD